METTISARGLWDPVARYIRDLGETGWEKGLGYLSQTTSSQTQLPDLTTSHHPVLPLLLLLLLPLLPTPHPPPPTP